MPEIFAISDHYTVLRNGPGSSIARGAISETNGEALARLMVGGGYVSGDLYQPRPRRFCGSAGSPARALPTFPSRCAGAGPHRPAGLRQQRGHAGARLGALIPEAGEVAVNGRALPSFGIHAAMQARISMLPSNPEGKFRLPGILTILENTTIAEHTLSARRQHISRRKEQQAYRRNAGASRTSRPPTPPAR